MTTMHELGQVLDRRTPLGKTITTKAFATLQPGNEFWQVAAIAATLPEGIYRLAAWPEAIDRDLFLLAWWHGTYRFERYKSQSSSAGHARLRVSAQEKFELAEAMAAATRLALDLVNAPPNHMGPEELHQVMLAVAKRHGARFEAVVGEALLEKNYPLVHAVGRASIRQPRVLDLRWGRPGATAVTLVGKGVCFDAGGLNLKSREGMLLMKKDMAGAAQAIALASLIMRTELDVDLRLLVPAVENAVAGNAYRPLDVILSRKRLQVEIGDTDAEGRLILADVLAQACETPPDLLIDFATLTGSMTKALGPEIAGFFTRDAHLRSALLAAGDRMGDPVWALPLHAPYRSLLNGRAGDIMSLVRYEGAGAILAAIFLAEFVDPAVPWIHLDFFGWNVTARPGRPVGAETHGLRAAYGLITELIATRATTRGPKRRRK